MSQLREEKLAELIKQEVSDILRKRVKDPRIGFVSITDVEVTGDLRHAKIFFSVLGDEVEKEETMEGLEVATGYIRRELGQRIRVRHVPELLFRYDNSLEHGARISRILNDLKEEGEVPGDESGKDSRSIAREE